MTLAQHPIPRPQADEYAPYFAQYLAKVPDGDLLDLLEAQWEELGCLLEDLDDEAADFRYAEGKWSVKEVLGHILDAERIFAYRLLRIARADPTPLAGFDENAYVAAAGFQARPLESLLEEYDLVRGHTLALLRGLDADCFRRSGTSNGKPVSARALAWLIAGHERHHMGVKPAGALDEATFRFRTPPGVDELHDD